jgi:serine protease AprX
MRPYSLTFAPGTTLETALAELPAVVETGDSMVWDDGTLTLGALAGRPELEALLATSPHLLALQEAEGEPEPSDERQGQIVAGNYAGYANGAVTGAVTSTGYLAWLTSRGLRTPGGHPTVAVFDTGFDDGSGVGGSHHPDLAGKLVGEGSYVRDTNTLAIEDTRGHGTMVAGIIAGDGSKSGRRDTQGFYLGTGIAPDVKLVAVQVMDSKNQPPCALKHSFTDPPTKIDEAIVFSRVTATGANKSVIGNHSWNTAATSYDSMAQLFDQRVIDAAPLTTGLQPMTLVVAAGNAGSVATRSTVLSPASAKNVISVGSTQSYRPSPPTQSGALPNECTLQSLNTDLFTREANNIAGVSAFSSRGTPFTPLGQVGVRLHTVRIKPDLVAPGGRVTSTVPYQSATTYVCQTLCRMYWSTGDFHSISSGTSFSAPVVTGIAALAVKWFSDHGLANPSPSLIKAALIATATDLGPVSGGDYRPSNNFGWGRPNLDRLTNSSVDRFFLTDNQANAVGIGKESAWDTVVDEPTEDTLIVLVWSDPASPVNVGQAPLINDLRLRVERKGTNSMWYGNNFRENIDGDDNGYSHRYTSAAAAKTDAVNTVEAVFIPANTFQAGQEIRIRITGVSGQSGSLQKFAVYAYNLRRSS